LAEVSAFPSERFARSTRAGGFVQEPESRAIPTPIQSPVAIYLAGLAPATRPSNRLRLDAIAGLLQPGTDATAFPWHELRYEDCVQLRVILQSRHKFQTANNYLYVLRGILRECWKLGLMSTDAYHRAVAVEPIKGVSLPAGRYVQRDEWAAFFRTLRADPTPLGIRDLAIFAVLRATGVRKAELLAMEVEDFNPREMTFYVIGKGNKQREVAADDWAREPLMAWLRLRGTRAGAMFCAVYRNGHVDPEHKPLSPSSLHLVLMQRIRQAGIPKFSLHDFRRNMATDLFDADVHIKAIMDQGGWSRAETAARYDVKRGQARIKAAMRNIPNPLDE
jgi:integrase/recombinase XerD